MLPTLRERRRQRTISADLATYIGPDCKPRCARCARCTGQITPDLTRTTAQIAIAEGYRPEDFSCVVCGMVPG